MNKNVYDLKKSDFVCVCIFVIMSILEVVNNFLGMKAGKAFNLSLPIFITNIVVIGIYFCPISSKVKGFIYSSILFAATISGLIRNPSDQVIHYNIAAAIAILGLYYSARLLISYSIMVNITLITVYCIKSSVLFGTPQPVSYLIKLILLVDSISVVLYFINKWGSEVLRKAIAQEEKVNELLKKLQSTFDQVEMSSSVLNKNVTALDDNMNSIVESSKETTKTMNEVAKGTQQQAESIYGINTNMTEAITEVNHTKSISDKISINSGLISEKVENDSEKIKSMSLQMQTINQAVGAALTTVNELQTNMQDINGLLESITYISKQTNLLSLNASIESARAGEQGKGFAVVAGEVGKLAEQSSQTVNNIRKITEVISEKTASAVEKVGLGEKAVKAGNTVLTEVGDNFKDIENTIKGTFELLETENNMIKRILDKFVKVQERIENIASISEEHSASNEEVLATIESENNDIISV